MKFKLDWDGRSYELEWHNETNFEEIGNLQSVLGFLFDKEGMLWYNIEIVRFSPSDPQGCKSI